MTSQTKKLQIIVIDRDKYWQIVYSRLSEKTKKKYSSFNDWMESDNSIRFSHFADAKMGIKILKYDSSDQIYEDVLKNTLYDEFAFEIIDQRKYFLAMLKYDI
jgi:hypothetical protein